MSDLSAIPTNDLAAEMAGRLEAAQAELTEARTQRDLLNELIRIKVAEVAELTRLNSALGGPRKRKTKDETPTPDLTVTAPVVPTEPPVEPVVEPVIEVVTEPAIVSDASPVDVVVPAFVPE